MRAAAEIPDLSAIYRAHVRDVGRWAERLAGPGFDVPDMVHEVFEIAQRRLPSFRGDSSVKTWLYGITEKVVRHRRRKDRLRLWLSGSARDVGRHLPGPGPSQELPGDEIAALLGIKVENVWLRMPRARALETLRGELRAQADRCQDARIDLARVLSSTALDDLGKRAARALATCP